MAGFSTAKVNAELKTANPDASYAPTDPARPLDERLEHAAKGKSDRCKTATVMWEDAFRLWKWNSRLMVALVTAATVMLVITLGVSVFKSSAVAAITGAAGTVVTGSAAALVKSERDKAKKLLDERTKDRTKACAGA